MVPIENARGDVWLVYDGECPICAMYCKRAQIQAHIGKLHLVDAREPSALMDEITAAGLDIDQGMVVKFDNNLYYGPQAMWVLTLMSTRYGFFNRVSQLFFGSQGRSAVFYPVGKAFRNLLLKILGIGYIENLKQADAKPIAK